MLHLSTAQSQSALLALEQMFSKGTIQAQELRLQLGHAIPGVMPRFEAAVMQMMQGTKNGTKTFDELLDKGALITKDMLPALTKALAESGTGWEEASQGLNANLNRLSTAWFKLKADLSTGLFSEAATAVAGTLATNLMSIASAATAVGAAYLVAFAGRSFQSLVAWIAKQGEAVAVQYAAVVAARAEALAIQQMVAAVGGATIAVVEQTVAQRAFAAASGAAAGAGLAAKGGAVVVARDRRHTRFDIGRGGGDRVCDYHGRACRG